MALADDSSSDVSLTDSDSDGDVNTTTTEAKNATEETTVTHDRTLHGKTESEPVMEHESKADEKTELPVEVARRPPSPAKKVYKLELQSLPQGALDSLKKSNKKLIRRLCRKQLSVATKMHEKEFKENNGFESLAMAVEKVCQDLMTARGDLRFGCQLVFQVMRYKSALVGKEDKLWNAITVQAVGIINITKSVFEKGVEYFGHLLSLRDSVIYCIKTQQGDNPLPPEKSLAQLKRDARDFHKFAKSCRKELSALDKQCMKGIQECLKSLIGDKSVSFTELATLKKEYEKALANQQEKQFELWEKRKKLTAKYVERITPLQEELLTIVKEIAKLESTRDVCEAKLKLSEKKVDNMQKAVDKSNAAYTKLQEKAAEAKDVQVVTDETSSRRGYYGWRWWRRYYCDYDYDWGRGSSSKTNKTLQTDDRKSLNELAKERKAVMDKERERLEKVEKSREEWTQELETAKASLKTKEMERAAKEKEVKKVAKKIEKVDEFIRNQEKENERCLAVAKQNLDNQYKTIQKACELTKVSQSNVSDFLGLFNCLVPCSQQMSARMVEFDIQIQTMEKLLSKKFANDDTLESLLTGGLKPFVKCLKDEGIETYEEFKCSREEFDEDYLPVFIEYAEEHNIKFKKLLQKKLRSIAMGQKSQKHYQVTLDGLSPLPDFFYGMYQGLSEACNQLSLDMSEEESSSDVPAIEQ